MSTRKMTKRQWILLAGGAALAAVPMGVLALIASAEPQIQPVRPLVQPANPRTPVNPPHRLVDPPSHKIQPISPNAEPAKPQPVPVTPQPVKPKSPLQELLSNMGSSDLANLF